VMAMPFDLVALVKCFLGRAAPILLGEGLLVPIEPQGVDAGADLADRLPEMRFGQLQILGPTQHLARVVDVDALGFGDEAGGRMVTHGALCGRATTSVSTTISTIRAMTR